MFVIGCHSDNAKFSKLFLAKRIYLANFIIYSFYILGRYCRVVGFLVFVFIFLVMKI